MKKKLCLWLVFALCLLLFAACGSAKEKAALHASGTLPETRQMRAADYLGLTKSRIVSLLGEKEQEEYYGGAMIYKFQNADMWFWFGEEAGSYDDVPENAQCEYVLAKLSDAAGPGKERYSREELSAALGFDFNAPEFNEHDSIYECSKEKDGVLCTVSCSKDGTASAEEDYVIYKVIK